MSKGKHRMTLAESLRRRIAASRARREQNRQQIIVSINTARKRRQLNALLREVGRV